MRLSGGKLNCTQETRSDKNNLLIKDEKGSVKNDHNEQYAIRSFIMKFKVHSHFILWCLQRKVKWSPGTQSSFALGSSRSVKKDYFRMVCSRISTFNEK